MNQIGAPWNTVVPSAGPQIPKITIFYLPRPGWWAEFIGEDTTDDSRVGFKTDPVTGLSLMPRSTNPNGMDLTRTPDG